MITKDSTHSSTVVVSFISMASGIDTKMLPVFEKIFGDYNQSKNCRLDSTIKKWGREGERDYCITSSNATCLKKFTSELKSKFKDNKRILIIENATCRK